MYSIELEKKIVVYTDDDEKREKIKQRKEQIDTLVDEINEITNLTHEVDSLIEVQGESIDKLEENVENANLITKKAEKELKLADKYLTKRNITIFGISVVLGAATGGGALALIGLNVVGGIISGVLGTGVTVLSKKGLSKI